MQQPFVGLNLIAHLVIPMAYACAKFGTTSVKSTSALSVPLWELFVGAARTSFLCGNQSITIQDSMRVGIYIQTGGVCVCVCVSRRPCVVSFCSVGNRPDAFDASGVLTCCIRKSMSMPETPPELVHATAKTSTQRSSISKTQQ